MFSWLFRKKGEPDPDEWAMPHSLHTERSIRELEKLITGIPESRYHCPESSANDKLIRELEKALNESAPSWTRRPLGPGNWLSLNLSGRCTYLQLTQEQIDGGAPFYSKAVYGPIPNMEALDGETDASTIH